MSDRIPTARVFFDAFAECLVQVAVARRYPTLKDSTKTLAVANVTGRHGSAHAASTGRMFDRLWNDLQSDARQ